MSRLEYAERFADDLARVTSAKAENHILACLDSIELFGGYGSPQVPPSIHAAFGDGVRKVAVSPFDLIYTFYPEKNLARIEALVHQNAAR